MNLIVGLGNPEEKYKHNRHNVGFMVIDSLLSTLPFTHINKSSFRGALYKSSNILLLKPLTFMNLSGQSIEAVSSYFKPDNIVVIHDDLDLPFGTLKFKFGGGHGGHNGLRSIDESIGKEYLRVRIGIGKPQSRDKVISHVLSDFSKNQQEDLEKIIKNAKEASLVLTKENLREVSQQYSLKVKKENK